MKIRHCMIIAFGKTCIEYTNKEGMPRGIGMVHISCMSKSEVKTLEKLFPETIEFIRENLGKDGVEGKEGFCLFQQILGKQERLKWTTSQKK